MPSSKQRPILISVAQYLDDLEAGQISISEVIDVAHRLKADGVELRRESWANYVQEIDTARQKIENLGLIVTYATFSTFFCVNSVCHLWGSQPHGNLDTSRDSWWVSLLTFGEGYHNYHHMYPSDYRNGVKWYNVDPSKWLIYSLSLLGLTSSLRRAKRI